MSCLSQTHRITKQKEFNYIYKNSFKHHTRSFILFFNKNTVLKIAAVASKKIGNAVKRNSAKRRLKALFLESQNQLITGSYIIVAKDTINDRSYKELKKDFHYSLKKVKTFTSK